MGKVFAALDPSGFQRTAELSAGVSAQMDCHPVASNKGGYCRASHTGDACRGSGEGKREGDFI